MKLKKEKGPLGLSFLCLIIPPAAAGDIYISLPLPRGINIYPSRCRGRDSKCCFPMGLSFYVLIYPWPDGQR